MIKKTACVILLFLTVLLTGCWSNTDIAELGIITGVGIDKASDGNVEITLQIFSPNGGGGNKSSSSSSQAGSSTINVNAEGFTVFDAARNMIPKLSEKQYYGNIQVLVISEDIAKDGLDKIWDFFERDHEVDKTFSLIVAKNCTAKSILDAESPVENVSAEEISNTIDNQMLYGKSVDVKAFNMSDLLSQPLTGIVTAVIDPEGSQNLTDMKVEGGAVFKEAKLVGYLDDEETKGYLFAANQIQSTILTVANPKDYGDLVSIELEHSDAALKADLINGEPKLGINVIAFGNIGDEQGSADLTDEEDIKTLERETEALIAENINDMLGKTQYDFDSDILNFNSLLNAYHYGDFKKIKDNWNTLYSKTKIDVTVQFTIKRSGIIKKPAYN